MVNAKKSELDCDIFVCAGDNTCTKSTTLILQENALSQSMSSDDTFTILEEQQGNTTHGLNHSFKGRAYSIDTESKVKRNDFFMGGNPINKKANIIKVVTPSDMNGKGRKAEKFCFSHQHYVYMASIDVSPKIDVAGKFRPANRRKPIKIIAEINNDITGHCMKMKLKLDTIYMITNNKKNKCIENKTLLAKIVRQISSQKPTKLKPEILIPCRNLLDYRIDIAPGTPNAFVCYIISLCMSYHKLVDINIRKESHPLLHDVI